MTRIEKLRFWLMRKSLKIISPIDYSLRPGDIVHLHNRFITARIIVINWALLAVAVKYDHGSLSSTVTEVLPVWVVKNVEIE